MPVEQEFFIGSDTSTDNGSKVLILLRFLKRLIRQPSELIWTYIEFGPRFKEIYT